MARKEFIGNSFGRLTVVSESEPYVHVGKDKRRIHRVMRCECLCGETRDIRLDYLISGAAKSCGCLQKEIVRENIKELHKTQRGEGNPNWKGGVHSESRRKRGLKSYKDFREEVLDRDFHECQKCFTDFDLCVHHIENVRDNPEKSDEVENGITLCQSCHTEFHRTFGYRNNTRLQIEEFLGQ